MSEEKEVTGGGQRRGSHIGFSVTMRAQHKERLDAIVAEAGVPTRNALIQCMAAVITVDQAKEFFKLASEQGAVNKLSTQSQREARKLLEGLTPEQIKGLIAAQQAAAGG